MPGARTLRVRLISTGGRTLLCTVIETGTHMHFIVDTEVRVPMRDDISLAAKVWRPASGEPAPTLLLRSPYGTDDLHVFGAPVIPDIFAFVNAGYAVMLQDIRGAQHSEGVFIPHVDDRGDGAATVAWLIGQDWCDGNVGMFGPSYMGFVQWQAASTGAPGLKAIAPATASDDFYHGPWYSPGGAFSSQCALSWTTVTSLMRGQFELAKGRSVDPADLATLAGLLADLPDLMRLMPTGSHPLLEKYAPWLATDVLAHPDRDEHWRRLAPIEHAESITAPALNIGGWYDIFINETFHAYNTMRRHGGSEEARKGQRLVIGPWAHGRGDSGVYPDRHFGMASSMDAAQLTNSHLSFFDRWLRGNEDALDDVAPVRIFVMGIDQWRDEQEWPLPDTQYIDYHLTGSGPANTATGGGLLTTTTPEAGCQDTYLYDPRRPVPTLGGTVLGLRPEDPIGPVDQRPNETREDVLCYTTPVLTQPVEVTGHVSLTLFASSSAVDTDFTGKLVDVHPDGRAIILCEGMQRTRYRNSLADPELMQPGNIYEVTVDLAVTSNVFLPGHRIRLEVSSSNFPRYNVNTNTGGIIAQETEADMITAVNRLHHGPVHPSRLTLPVIDRPDTTR
ncbi:CocE/NonD family hydrolase [Streptomyces sp. NBC_00075]|uniref:CocE/NonD family hydrolase n=1 Tax=Streptomyces sp. NBC_00075 TaxID=2975641 RepID=UPI0032512FF9